MWPCVAEERRALGVKPSRHSPLLGRVSPLSPSSTLAGPGSPVVCPTGSALRYEGSWAFVSSSFPKDGASQGDGGPLSSV